MKIPVPLLDAITTCMRDNISNQIVINDFQELSGGCINNGGRLDTSKGNFFLKWNSSERFPGMFKTESMGLRLLSSATAMKLLP
jgi:fructosamine-3-kinase